MEKESFWKRLKRCFRGDIIVRDKSSSESLRERFSRVRQTASNPYVRNFILNPDYYAKVTVVGEPKDSIRIHIQKMGD